MVTVLMLVFLLQSPGESSEIVPGTLDYMKKIQSTSLRSQHSTTQNSL